MSGNGSGPRLMNVSWKSCSEYRAPFCVRLTRVILQLIVVLVDPKEGGLRRLPPVDLFEIGMGQFAERTVAG
jgi:hypothetical protein